MAVDVCGPFATVSPPYSCFNICLFITLQVIYRCNPGNRLDHRNATVGWV
jgi:hypothetical protein